MTQTKSKGQKLSNKDIIFNILLYGLCGLILLMVAYPLYFIIIASFSSPSEVSNGNVWFWPSQFTVDGYKELFRHGDIWTGYLNTILYTVGGHFHRPAGEHLGGLLPVPQGLGGAQADHLLLYLHHVLQRRLDPHLLHGSGFPPVRHLLGHGASLLRGGV